MYKFHDIYLWCSVHHLFNLRREACHSPLPKLMTHRPDSHWFAWPGDVAIINVLAASQLPQVSCFHYRRRCTLLQWNFELPALSNEFKVTFLEPWTLLSPTLVQGLMSFSNVDAYMLQNAYRLESWKKYDLPRHKVETVVLPIIHPPVYVEMHWSAFPMSCCWLTDLVQTDWAVIWFLLSAIQNRK